MTPPNRWFRIPFSLHLLLVGAGVVLFWTLVGPSHTVQAGAGHQKEDIVPVPTERGEFLDGHAVDLLIGADSGATSKGSHAPENLDQLAPILHPWEPEGYEPMVNWSEDPQESQGNDRNTIDDADLLDLIEAETDQDGETPGTESTMADKAELHSETQQE